MDARIKQQEDLDRTPWPVKDPNAPFGHIGRIPGGMYDERAAMKKHPHYFAPDQLYNLQKDPDEQVNLVDNPEYKAKLEEMKKEMFRYFNEKNIPGPYAECKKHQ